MASIGCMLTHMHRLALTALTLLSPLPAFAAFSDVPATHPHATAIDYVQEEELVNGYADGSFKPDANINRAEFLKIVVASKFTEKAITTCDPVSIYSFSDTLWNAWYSPFLCIAVQHRIASGYANGSFKPSANINVAEAAKIIAVANQSSPKQFSATDPWYKTYVTPLAEAHALPTELSSFTQPLTRGQMAEIIYRLHADKTKLPSHTYETLQQSTMAEATANLHIPILVYHHIRPTGSYAKSTWSWKMSVSPSVFNTHMQWLKDHNYTTIDLDTYVNIVQGKTTGPEKPVVITFDDNQLSVYEWGMPVMEKHGQKAVFYLITDRLDAAGALSRDQVKDLVARGMDIQSHTLSHRVLTALPAEEIEREMTESKKILEELTGKPIHHVAYPGTSHNATVRERTKAAGYWTGTIMDPRWSTGKDDPFKLPRIMMTDDTNLAKTLP